MQNWLDTVISQYGNSPVLRALIESTNDAIDPSLNIDAFFNLVWNVDTAQGYGLDVWGRIVGVSRELAIPANSDFFGFDTGVADEWQPFNQAPFFSGGGSGGGTFELADDAYRVLILFKALSNIATTTIPMLNKLITSLFTGLGHSSPRCWVVDNGSMTMTYVFNFVLTAIELAIVTSPGLLPHPTGVAVNVSYLDPTGTFGFFEMGGMQTFNNGTFL